jgi:hypothetical protein
MCSISIDGLPGNRQLICCPAPAPEPYPPPPTPYHHPRMLLLLLPPGGVESADLVPTLPPQLRHFYLLAPSQHRVDTLRKCINALQAQRALVFMNFQQRLKDTQFKLEASSMEVGGAERPPAGWWLRSLWWAVTQLACRPACSLRNMERRAVQCCG